MRIATIPTQIMFFLSHPANAGCLDGGEGTTACGKAVTQSLGGALGAKLGGPGGAAVGPVVAGEVYDGVNELAAEVFDSMADAYADSVNTQIGEMLDGVRITEGGETKTYP